MALQERIDQELSENPILVDLQEVARRTIKETGGEEGGAARPPWAWPKPIRTGMGTQAASRI